MLPHFRFRLLVAVSGTAIAEAFGAVGLWQRSRILSQPLLSATLWDSTARFHVWPWPFKFAAIWALPAFISGSIVMIPVRLLLTTLPEAAELVPTGASALILWFWVASRLEGYSPAIRWTSFGVFFALSLIGAFLPLGYTGWLIPYGALAWCIAALMLRRSPRSLKGHVTRSA
jgi:hypothetical protein